MRHAVLLLLWLFSCCAQGQSVTNVKFDPLTGTYALLIDGKLHVAMANARLEQMEALIERQRAELASGKGLTDAYEKLRKDYVELSARYRALTDDSLKLNEKYSQLGHDQQRTISDYRTLVADYDALTQKYRDFALRTAARQKIDVGLGMVHAADEDRLVGMAGIGTDVFGLGVRGWVFGGQNTYGVMFGVSF